MTVTKIYCDHCGKEIDGMHDWIQDEIMIANERIVRDLCADCGGDLIKIIEDFCSNATVEKGAQA